MLAQKVIKLFISININDFTFAYRIYPKHALKNVKFQNLETAGLWNFFCAHIKKIMILLQCIPIG